MDRKRIEAIRSLGDTLASYVKEQDDKRFFRKFYRVQNNNDFMVELIKADKNYTARGHTPPLFGLDSFCNVFLEQTGDGEELKLDWRFARDLVFIRMIEQLHENNWFKENPVYSIMIQTQLMTRITSNNSIEEAYYGICYWTIMI